MTSVSRGEAPAWLDVSRETLVGLDAFLSLVEKWNPVINLVAKGSLPIAWERHVLDSAQLIHLCPGAARHWVDFGSGGGFPGVVIAVIARQLRPGLRMTLIESDKRKAAFLVQASRELGLDIAVRPVRSESLAPSEADVISARALAPLSELCALASRHLQREGLAILPKGAQADAELVDAGKLWQFESKSVQSLTDPLGSIITMKNVRNV
ncbi:MAG: 16S rRNA (guanine(527)-N(7))-methyltransferase RsmG [Cypionkella sp.]